jgi:hypothetical protein
MGDDDTIMTTRCKVGTVAVLAAAMLFAGPITGGAAWAKKSKMKCKIDGKTFKTNARGGGGGGAYEQPIERLTLVGGRGKYKGRNPATIEIEVQLLTFVVFPIPDLATATFPLTVPVTDTVYNYDHTKGISVIEAKLWQGEGVTMTIDSFDGTRIKGTASGMIPPDEGVDAPALLEDCKFSVELNGLP